MFPARIAVRCNSKFALCQLRNSQSVRYLRTTQTVQITGSFTLKL